MIEMKSGYLKYVLFGYPDDDPDDDDGYCKYLRLGMAGADNYKPDCVLTERVLDWQRCKDGNVHESCPFLGGGNENSAYATLMEQQVILSEKFTEFERLLRIAGVKS